MERERVMEGALLAWGTGWVGTSITEIGSSREESHFWGHGGRELWTCGTGVVIRHPDQQI